MNEAVRWVLENSRLTGTMRMVLLVMAARSEGCLVLSKLETLRRDLRLSKRHMRRLMSDAIRKKEVERLQELSWTKPSAFHLQRCCRWMGDMAGRSHRVFRCSYQAYASTSYRQWPSLSSIARPEMSSIGILLPEMVESIARAKRLEEPIWKQEISEAEVEFMGRQMRQRLGIPLRAPGEFRLRP